MSKLSLYRVYDYSDDEGSRVRNYGYYWAMSGKEAVIICANNNLLNKGIPLRDGMDLYVELISAHEYFKSSVTLLEGFCVGRKDQISNMFRFTKQKTELEALSEKAQNSGMSFTEMKRFIELAGK